MFIFIGSTALHLAAASGRHLICAMLAKQKGIQLLLRDSEGVLQTHTAKISVQKLVMKN